MGSFAPEIVCNKGLCYLHVRQNVNLNDVVQSLPLDPKGSHVVDRHKMSLSVLKDIATGQVTLNTHDLQKICTDAEMNILIEIYNNLIGGNVLPSSSDKICRDILETIKNRYDFGTLTQLLSLEFLNGRIDPDVLMRELYDYIIKAPDLLSLEYGEVIHGEEIREEERLDDDEYGEVIHGEEIREEERLDDDEYGEVIHGEEIREEERLDDDEYGEVIHGEENIMREIREEERRDEEDRRKRMGLNKKIKPGVIRILIVVLIGLLLIFSAASFGNNEAMQEVHRESVNKEDTRFEHMMEKNGNLILEGGDTRWFTMLSRRERVKIVKSWHPDKWRNQDKENKTTILEISQKIGAMLNEIRERKRDL